MWANYLGDPRDVAILVEGIEVALSLANTSAMAKYNMTLSNRPLPACSRFPFLSRDYWACAVRQDTGPENHQAGSCKMGPPNDPMAVVDHKLRVYGVRNLRVADTSIMPQVSIVLAAIAEAPTPPAVPRRRCVFRLDCESCFPIEQTAVRATGLTGQLLEGLRKREG